MDLANKYRPRRIDDMVGQPVIVQTIKNAILKNKLHHAYLLCGTFGSGKSSLARIISASENCLISPGLYPCGKCDVCEGVFAGKHVDIEEIDAASNAGSVEEVRKLKNAALYNPIAGAKGKTFILDEIHRASATSLDSLLKLLEEPPPRVRFILCTTDINKVKPTIQSRCQRHDFRQIPWSLISEHLEKVAGQEKLSCEKAALNLCARMSHGSMRAALQNLDKLIDFTGKNEITIADAQLLFAQASEILYYDLIDSLIGKPNEKPDASIGFRVINNIFSTGIEFMSVYENIAEHLRHLMVGLTCVKASEFVTVSEEGKRRLMSQLSECKQNNKINGVLESIRLLGEVKRAVDSNISPEMALQTWIVNSIFAFRK